MPESQPTAENPKPIREQFVERKSKLRVIRLLEHLHRPWIYPLYGSTYEDHRYHFGDLLPKASSLPPNAVLVELMGPGELFRSLQQEGQQVSGVALTLTDLRGIRARLFDRANNNAVIAGDILDKSTWRKLNMRLANRPADLVVCSPGGGDVNIPASTRVYAGLLDRAYRLLNQNGQLVVDVPAIFNKYLNQLEDTCFTNDIGFRRSHIPPYSEDYYDSKIAIQRRESSPSSLAGILGSTP